MAEPYQYKPRDRVSITLSRDDTFRVNQPSEEIIETRLHERKKTRVSYTTNIEEKYNKYVVNGHRKSNNYSRMTTANRDVHKDVSLILAGEESKISKISKISPKPLKS